MSTPISNSKDNVAATTSIIDLTVILFTFNWFYLYFETSAWLHWVSKKKDFFVAAKMYTVKGTVSFFLVFHKCRIEAILLLKGNLLRAA